MFDYRKLFSCPNLVGGLEHEFYDLPYIGNFIIPTDLSIFFQRGRLKPPTSNCDAPFAAFQVITAVGQNGVGPLALKGQSLGL